jgi:hypothetical protein
MTPDDKKKKKFELFQGKTTNSLTPSCTLAAVTDGD